MCVFIKPCIINAARSTIGVIKHGKKEGKRVLLFFLEAKVKEKNNVEGKYVIIFMNHINRHMFHPLEFGGGLNTMIIFS